MEKVLLSMGYRQLAGKNAWAKPIGKMMFVFTTDDNTFCSLFYPANAKEIAGGSKELFENNMDFLEWLQSTEARTRTDIHPNKKGFEFLTIEEYVKQLLDS